MRRPFLLAACGMLCAVVLSPRIAPAQQAAASAAPSALDSISAQLVELELQRASSRSAGIPRSRVQGDVDSQIAALHDRLRALPNGAIAEREATNRLIAAFDVRAAGVRLRLRELRSVYTDAHPTVLQAEGEERAIDQRLAEIRSR